MTPDAEEFIAELLAIWRQSGLHIRCKPQQFAAVVHMIMLTDLYAGDLGEANASAVDFMLEALADKLTK